MNQYETIPIPQSILDEFDLTGLEDGERAVACPFHKDEHPSAGINISKRVFFCHSCKRGMSFVQLDAALLERRENEAFSRLVDELADKPKPKVEVEFHMGKPYAPVDPEEYIKNRGFDPENLGLDWYVEDGYLMYADGIQGRNISGDNRPKYLSEKGDKPLLWLGPEPTADASVWLVEGVFDALTLHKLMPSQPVACSFGSHLSELQAYELVGRTVFICYDADFAGYKGARQAMKRLAEYDANGIILDFPKDLGHDLNEAMLQDEEMLEAWLWSVLAQYASKDRAYVDKVFGGNSEDDLIVIPTGLGNYDEMLNGGYRPGLHIIAAESGVGKSSFAVAFATNAARAGKRVLYVTNEISKRQVWARIASNLDGETNWADIEAAPRSIGESTLHKLEELADRVRVVAGWNVSQIKYVAHKYDVVVVDYLQRMGGPYKGEAVKANIDYNITELSDLGRDHGKIVVTVSSLNRVGYGQMDKSSLKESGNIEYVAQSITGLKRAQGSERVMGLVLKNTRGAEDIFWMKIDLAHQRYEDSLPGESKKTDKINTEVLKSVEHKTSDS